LTEQLRTVRGFRDILPEEASRWQRLEQVLRAILEAYGYREIRLPILELTEVFSRSIGEATDIVEKEMYTFADRNGDSLSLRPEGTAGCVRAALQSGLLHNQVQRLWYCGPMFRHERPQKGRYRQFNQIGAEAFGFDGPDIDAELILMNARMWRMLGLRDVRLQLNNIGTPQSRGAYRRQLVDYFSAHRAALDEDSLRRLERNPMRILDSKNPAMAGLIAQAPPIDDALDASSRGHFEELQAMLAANAVDFEINPRLVRGFDYYTNTVFEWVTTALGAQATVCAGGRYDGLVEYFGGRPTPAIGFAIGLERLLELMAFEGIGGAADGPQVYIACAGEGHLAEALRVAEALRDALPGLRIVTHCGGGSLKSQLRRADRCGAAAAIIIGEAELAAGSASLKSLRGDGGQRAVGLSKLAREVAQLLGGPGIEIGGESGTAPG
jgi:histidyl-tRNA synthetase